MQPRNFFKDLPKMHRHIPWGCMALYQMIYQLSNVKGYCWATNKKLSEMGNKSTRTITRGIAELQLEGFISVEGEGKARKIRITGKLHELEIVIDDVPFTEPTQTGSSMLDEMNVDKFGNQHRQILHTNIDNFGDQHRQILHGDESEKGLNALGGMPSGAPSELLINYNNKEIIINKKHEAKALCKEESEADASPSVFSFTPVMKQKRSYKKRQKKSDQPLSEEEKNLQEQLQVLISSEAFKPAWDSFVRHRKSLKAPLTRESANLVLKELLKLSGSDPIKAIAVLNQTIMNGWKGLFPVKDDKNTKGVVFQDTREERKLKVIDLSDNDNKDKK